MTAKTVEPMGGKALMKPGATYAMVKEAAQLIPATDDTEDVGELILARIMSSQTLDQALTPSTAPSLGELEGRPITVVDIRRKDGGLNQDLGFYLLVAIEDQSTGEQTVYSTGALNVVGQLVLAHQMGWIPFHCKLVAMESKSNPGQSVHWLVGLDNF